MSIGTKIRRIREEKGFTQEIMAEKIGMSQPSYNRIESDKNKTLSWEIVQRIAQVLEIDVSELQAEDYQVTITNQAKVEHNDGIVYQQTDERLFQFMEKRLEDKDKLIKSLEQQLAMKDQLIHLLQTEVENLKNKS